jgi:large subunit ribosomal protein L3
MPGQMGNKRRTVLNLKIVDVRADDNLMLIRGGVPGPRGGSVLIRKAVKA